MKVYLRVDKGWELFEITENSKELTKRRIKIGKNVKISNNNVYIGSNVDIGDDVEIGDFVTIGDNVIIGGDTIKVEYNEGVGVEISMRFNEEVKNNNNVIVGNNVRIGNYTAISNNVIIDNNVKIVDHTTVGCNVTINSNVLLGSISKLDNSIIVSNTKVTKSPLHIVGTRDSIAECGKGLLEIGCLVYSIEYWLKNYKRVGEENFYTKEEIKEYGEHIKYASKHMTL